MAHPMLRESRFEQQPESIQIRNYSTLAHTLAIILGIELYDTKTM